MYRLMILFSALTFLFVLTISCKHSQGRNESGIPANMTGDELADYLEEKADKAVSDIVNRRNWNQRRIAEQTLIRIGERCVPKLKYAVEKMFNDAPPESYGWAWTPEKTLMRVLVALDEVDLAPQDVRLSYYWYMLMDAGIDEDKCKYLLSREGRAARLALRKFITETYSPRFVSEGKFALCVEHGGEYMAMVRAIWILALEYDDEWILDYAKDILINAKSEFAKGRARWALWHLGGPDVILILCEAYAKEQNAEQKKEILSDIENTLTMRNDQLPRFEAPDVDAWVQALSHWIRENRPYLYVGLSHNPPVSDIIMIQSSKTEMLLIDEESRRAGVPHNVWVYIPDNERQNWAQLTSNRRRQLSGEAYDILHKVQKEKEAALAAAVSFEIWRLIPQESRDKWSTFSFDKQEQLIAEAEKKLLEEAGK